MSSTMPGAPNFRLDGKRALVTGASRGLGAAAASALAACGAAVVLVSRNADELSATAEEICRAGGTASARALDVTDIAAIHQLATEEAPFDVLVSSAGTNRPSTFTKVTEEDYDAVMALNVKATFFAAQAISRRMIEGGRRGSIVNISSQMGHVGGRMRTAYCCSKFAVEGLTKAMAIDLAPHGIRVNTLCPTFIETAMTKSYFADARFRSDVLSKIKLGRLGLVGDITGGLVYLASEASSLVTGTSLLIDGGWTAD